MCVLYLSLFFLFYIFFFFFFFFFFQAEDGIRDDLVTGVQTCALPISRIATRKTLPGFILPPPFHLRAYRPPAVAKRYRAPEAEPTEHQSPRRAAPMSAASVPRPREIGKASCRERV